MGDDPMSEAGRFARPDVRDMTPEQLDDLLDSQTPLPATPAEEANLLAMLPPPGEPDAPLNVVRSLRLPEDLSRRLDDAAEAEGISASVFIRRAIESALAGRNRSNLVSLDDVYRALGSLPKAAA